MNKQKKRELNRSFYIGMKVELGEGVKISKKANLSHCIIGDQCSIGPHVEIHHGVMLGKRVKLFSFINLYGCQIGNDSKISAFVEIQKGAVVGERCKISSHTFLCEGVTLKNEVFIGHGVKFINDRFPQATREDGKLKDDDDWVLRYHSDQ